MSDVFHIERPRGPRLPILLSCPHSGTEIPDAIARTMHPDVAAAVPDTDWFVHELYDFAPEMGITLIRARLSRFVVDLNRDPSGQKLYADGRSETTHVPVRTFAGAPIYHGGEPDQTEIARRMRLYFEPYHAQVAVLLDELRREHAHVLFYDAHSIRRLVPSVRPTPFPDMILGDQRGRTAAPILTETALRVLRRAGTYAVSHNDPFMGGYLTRRFGQPERGVSALQLEMAQDIYMDEDRGAHDATKQAAVARILRDTLTDLATAVGQLA